jgi:hypothetical protein
MKPWPGRRASVLECGSPLPVFFRSDRRGVQSARALAPVCVRRTGRQSKSSRPLAAPGGLHPCSAARDAACLPKPLPALRQRSRQVYEAVEALVRARLEKAQSV